METAITASPAARGSPTDLGTAGVVKTSARSSEGGVVAVSSVAGGAAGLATEGIVSSGGASLTAGICAGLSSGSAAGADGVWEREGSAAAAGFLVSSSTIAEEAIVLLGSAGSDTSSGVVAGVGAGSGGVDSLSEELSGKSGFCVMAWEDSSLWLPPELSGGEMVSAPIPFDS